MAESRSQLEFDAPRFADVTM